MMGVLFPRNVPMRSVSPCHLTPAVGTGGWRSPPVVGCSHSPGGGPRSMGKPLGQTACGSLDSPKVKTIADG